MKKVTYYLGYCAALCSALAVIFKVNHLAYAGTVVSIALILLCIYFPIYIIDKTKDPEGKTFPVHVVGALCAFIFILGIVFKINHWFPAGAFLAAGLAGFSLIFVPMLFIRKSKQAGANNLMNAAGALGLSLFALGMLTKIQHWPGQIPLVIAGVALVFIIYFPMLMMNKSTSDEKMISHLRDTFFIIIIGCFLILFALGMIGVQLVPPGDNPQTTEQIK